MQQALITGTQWVLITGTRSRTYPESGVRAAFGLVQRALKAAGASGQPVVIVHGKCDSGVDDMAERLAPEYGWTTEPHPADWPRCSPLCEGMPPSHRRLKYGSPYCPMAGFWRNQEMANEHHRRPYLACLALPLPNRSWLASPGTYDCYNRAKKAGVMPTVALDDKGEFFINQGPQPRGARR